jgi:CheY-like chemotaxis protein
VTRTVLVIEDGTEYVDAMRSLASSGPVELVRAADVQEARRTIAERRFDAVFLDVVFDRTPPEKLAGDLEALIRRFGGDRSRAERHLAENQGFYALNELAGILPATTPVVIAYDFSAEPDRLAALRRAHPNLSGLPDGTPISEVLERLLGEVTTGGTPGDPPGPRRTSRDRWR